MKFTSPATTSNVRSDGFPIRWMSDQDVRSEDHGGGGSETIKQERVFVFPGPTSTTSNVRSDDFPIRWMSDQNVRSQDHGEEGGGWVKL